MYRDNSKPAKIHYNFVYDEGGLGDIVASLPIQEYVTRNHPHVVQHLWVPDYFVDFAKRCLSPGPIIRGYSDSKKYKNELLARNFKGHRVSNFAVHSTDYAAMFLLGMSLEPHEKNYLKPRLDDIEPLAIHPYVVVCTGHTSPVRQMLPQYVNEISEYLWSKGHIPIFLGKDSVQAGGGAFEIKTSFNEEINYSLGVDLRGRTDMVHAAKIIDGAAAIVGVDNGLLHLAGCTDTAIVGGFTSVRPSHRMPYRRGMLGWNYYPVTLTQKELACINCQSNWSFSSTLNHRFERCYYNPAGEGAEIDCVRMLTADRYIEQLEKCL